MAVREEESRKIYRFDGFQLDARKRVLLRGGRPVTLNSKAFDLLLVLAASGGRELSKDELLESVWRDQIVEENNLAVHIYNLRKILGERKDEHRYIITIPGVGYRFVADVDEAAGEPEELYIESRTLSRIVVEEEEGGGQTVGEGVIAPAALASLSQGETASGEAIYSTARAATATAIAPLVQARQQKIVLPVAALVGLLLTAGFGGYWLYRNRSQASVIPAPESRRPMAVTRVTNGGLLGASSISPDGKFIAYIENAPAGAGTIFVQQTDTNTVLRLLEPADRSFGCTNFSPDGSLIYYVASDKRNPVHALYSVPVLGGPPKRIMGNFSSCFSLSPDGKQVVFSRTDDENKRTSLMIAALDGGGEQTLLARARDESGFGFTLAWSPDGRLIAFGANPEPHGPLGSPTIMGVDVSSGATRPLTTERFYETGKMSWTGDGRNLVFVARRPRGINQLYLMDYPSGEVRQITSDVQSYGNYGLGVTADASALVADMWERKEEIWSVGVDGDASRAVRVKGGTSNGRLGITALPDGRIAYIARTGNGMEIWTAREDGTEARALTTDAFAQKGVAASPDGRYLIFASADSAGGNHLFRMNADDGSEVTQLTFGATADTQPDVSPDGEWVVYASSDGRRTTVWKVPLTSGAAVQLTDDESGLPVFAPDGKTIACVLPGDSRGKPASIAIIPAEGGKPTNAFPVMPFQHDYNYPIRWTPDGQAVVFGKHRNHVFDLWRQSLSGEAPRPLTNFPNGAIWNFAYARDGKRIFLSRGQTFIDVVLIKNFRS